jgi:GT2 family glycosyltransferase
MSGLAFQCRPFAEIAGGPLIWQSTSDEPWIEITPNHPLRNRWVRLTWRSGLLQPNRRPVLRCVLDDPAPSGDVDVFLPGAPFGRASAIVHVPANTRRVLISPANWAGTIRFQLETVEILPLPRVLAIAAGRSAGGALHALGAGLIGRPADLRHLLRNALIRVTPDAYPRWLRAGSRPLDPGFDGAPPEGLPHIRLLIEAANEDAHRIRADITALADDLAHSARPDWSMTVLCAPEIHADLKTTLPRSIRLAGPDAGLPRLIDDLAPADLVAAVPLGTRVHRDAFAMLATAATAAPGIGLFYGDNDHWRGDGDGDGCDPVVRAGFDPLLLARVDTIGASAFWRVEVLRTRQTPPTTGRLPDPAEANDAMSLSRFIFRLACPASRPILASPAAVKPDQATLPAPSAAILIPTRDRVDLLRPCVDSILQKTPGFYRIVILDNESREPDTLAYFEMLRADPRVAVRPVSGPFNFSRICNDGARSCSEAVLVFLNNDTLVIDSHWLAVLTADAMRPEVGAVGLKLLFPDGRVQHAGVIGGLFGGAGHFDLRMGRNDPGYFGRANLPHRQLAVTGACLAVARDKFNAIGGFDERNLPVDLNDIDLCFRLHAKGWHTVQRGDIEMYHYESATRGYEKNTDFTYGAEKKYFRETWLLLLRDDPYFSANLSLYALDGRLV